MDQRKLIKAEAFNCLVDRVTHLCVLYEKSPGNRAELRRARLLNNRLGFMIIRNIFYMPSYDQDKERRCLSFICQMISFPICVMSSRSMIAIISELIDYIDNVKKLNLITKNNLHSLRFIKFVVVENFPLPEIETQNILKFSRNFLSSELE